MIAESRVLFTGLIALWAAERLAEVLVSSRNARRSLARGGREHGRSHYPALVALHAAFLCAPVAEVWLLERPFLPALGWPMLGLALGAQALRWWCIRALGPRWSTRVIVVPGLPPVSSGPYRLLRHPNYLAVAVEGVALPLVHAAWLTAAAFTVLNGVLLLRFRIPVEERALAEAAAS